MKLFSQKMGSGDPFVILHGLFGSSDNWMSIARHFSSSYSIHLIDARNHGKSPHTEQFGYDNMAMDVREYLEDHSLRNIILMGHSMGGKVGMKLALEYPMRVKKLIVADIAPKKYSIIHNQIIEALNSIEIENISTREQADEQLAQSIKSSSLRKFLLKNLQRKEDNSFEWQINLDAICRNLDALGAEVISENKYEGDVLFLQGELSDYILPSDEKNIRDLFPNSIIKTVPQATHWLHAENPDFFVTEVKKFLQI